MRTLALVLMFVLLLAGFARGEVPVLKHVVDPVTLPATATQRLDLWIDASGPWQFHAKCPDSLRFLDQDGCLVKEGPIISGNSSLQSSHVLEVHFDLAVLSAGSHRLQMQVCLEGAQGILGLPIFPHTWILPLNHAGVTVYREGRGTLSIPSEQWFLLEPGDRLFCDQQELFMPGLGIQSQAVQVEEIQTGLWWTPSFLHVETGDWGDLTLNIEGPSPAGELLIGSNSYLRLDRSWFLNGKPLDVSRDGEDSLCIRIPALPPGVHEVRGSVQALLAPLAVQGELSALWQGKEATCRVQIDRDWFELDAVQRLQVDSTSPLLLPSGHVHRMHGRGDLFVDGRELNVLIPLDDPAQPIWTGLPLATSVVHSPPTNGDWDFVLPVFLWDRGFSWRLVTQSGPWFLDATPKRQRLHVEGGSRTTRVEVVTSKQIVSVTSAPQGIQEAGDWSWWETADFRKGIYNQGKWLWSVNLPKDSGPMPALAVQYSSDTFGASIGPEDLALRFSSDAWAWGASFKSRRVWMETFQPLLRLDVSSQGVMFAYQRSSHEDLRVQWRAGHLHLELKGGSWEAYLKTGSQASLEGGVRWQKSFSQENVLSAFRGALQIKNEMTFLETRGQLGYVLSPRCTLYVEGGARTSFSWKEQLAKLDLCYGAGVMIYPMPQVVAQAGWNHEQGWHAKAGVVVPFVGRKTSIDFE